MEMIVTTQLCKHKSDIKHIHEHKSESAAKVYGNNFKFAVEKSLSFITSNYIIHHAFDSANHTLARSIPISRYSNNVIINSSVFQSAMTFESKHMH